MKNNDLVQKYAICFLILIVSVFYAPHQGQSETQQILSFYNTHTHERLTVTYKKGASYVPEAMNKISKIMRDHRTGDIHPIDPELMDFLYDLLTEVSNHGEVQKLR